jgi:hypothetical protein
MRFLKYIYIFYNDGNFPKNGLGNPGLLHWFESTASSQLWDAADG